MACSLLTNGRVVVQFPSDLTEPLESWPEGWTAREERTGESMHFRCRMELVLVWPSWGRFRWSVPWHTHSRPVLNWRYSLPIHVQLRNMYVYSNPCTHCQHWSKFPYTHTQWHSVTACPALEYCTQCSYVHIHTWIHTRIHPRIHTLDS